MFKVLAFIKAKEGLTNEEFISHYENHHSPLIRRLFPWIVEYRRHYLPFEPSVVIGPREALPFDVVTEIIFDDEDGLQKMLKKYDDDNVSKEIAEDEFLFIDRSKTILITCK